MGINSRRIKNRAMEILESDDYQEAKDEAFDEEFTDEFTSEGTLQFVTYDGIQGFLDSFTFPDEGDWAMDKACGEADDWADAKYEEQRDREMGL